MGLLEKAFSFIKKDSKKKMAMGLLARAISYSELIKKVGLLEKVEKYHAKEEQVEGIREGLLIKAQNSIDERVKGREGLLARAISIRERFEFEGKVGLLERAERFIREAQLIKEGLEEEFIPEEEVIPEEAILEEARVLEEAGLLDLGIVVEEKIPVEEAFTEMAEVELGIETEEIILDEGKGYFEEGIGEEERVKVDLETITEEERKGKALLPEEVLLAEEEKAPFFEEPEERKVLERTALKEEEIIEREEAFLIEEEFETYTEQFEYYLKEKEALKIFTLFDEIIRIEGYQYLFAQILETLIRMCRGKKGALFSLQGDFFDIINSFPEDFSSGALKQLKYSKDSKILKLLREKRNIFIRPADMKDEVLKFETHPLESIKPWAIIPLKIGMDIPGFAILGQLPKRLKVERKDVLLFTQIAALYINRYFRELYIMKQGEQFNEEIEEKESILSMYDFSRDLGDDIGGGLERMVSAFGIESAMLIKGWDDRRKLTISASVGIQAEILKVYRISSNDRDIREIVESREPGIPRDVRKRVSQLLKEGVKSAKTYIVNPVIYNNEVLALLIILSMAKVGKKIPSRQRMKLKHLAQGLIPYLLYSKLKSLDPYLLFESFLLSEMKRANQKKYPLFITSFVVKNFKEVLKVYGYDHYREFIEGVMKILLDHAGEDALIKRLRPDMIVMLLRNLKSGEGNENLRLIKRDISEWISREKKEKIPNLTSKSIGYPEECKGISDILSVIA